MNFLQTRAKVVQRSQGRSAVASASYRSGEKMVDERQGMTFEYQRKERIKFTGLYFPDGVKRMTRSEVWNGVEKAHKRGDATTAREIEFALPHVIDEDHRLEIAQFYGQVFAKKYGVAVDVSVHTSDSENGNWHCHMLMSACSLSTHGFGKKVLELDPHHCNIHKIEKPIDYFRRVYEQTLNNIYKSLGIDMRVDRRSFAEQGIEKIPTVHVGPRNDEDLVELNQRIREYNSRPPKEAELEIIPEPSERTEIGPKIDLLEKVEPIPTIQEKTAEIGKKPSLEFSKSYAIGFYQSTVDFSPFLLSPEHKAKIQELVAIDNNTPPEEMVKKAIVFEMIAPCPWELNVLTKADIDDLVAPKLELAREMYRKELEAEKAYNIESQRPISQSRSDDRGR